MDRGWGRRGERGEEGPYYIFGDPYAADIDGRRNLVSSFFGGKDPFDDPLFNSMFASNLFGPSGPTMFGSEPPSNSSSGSSCFIENDSINQASSSSQPNNNNKSKGPEVIEQQIVSHDDDKEDEDKGQKKDNPSRKHSSSTSN